MIREFNKYINEFDVSNEDVMNKVEHSIRMKALMEEYAKKLGYSKEDIILAGEIGLLHDIGRFEQLNFTKSVCDTDGFDHAEYAVSYLFKEGFITKFNKNIKDYEIIKYAIKNHNKHKLPSCSDVRCLKLAKLLRDVDKIDILNMFGALKESDYKYNGDNVSNGISKALLSNKCAKLIDVKSNTDYLALRFGFAFDINNPMCYRELKEKMIEYYNNLENNTIYKEIYENAIKYIDSKMI